MADEVENRVIAHFDIDCFYAQSEELRCPSLRGRPVGVTQKFLVVTSNYKARSMGVPKMVSIDEAKRKVPSLVLVNGEDLTPYRTDSKRIMAVLGRFGTLEKCGLDEGIVDITAQVRARLRSNSLMLSFRGRVLGLEQGQGQGQGQGLRLGLGQGRELEKSEEEEDEGVLKKKGRLVNFQSMQLDCQGPLATEDVVLLAGCQLVSEMRAALESETGYRCSCGVAENKMLAKLSSSLNKPSMQTCLLRGAVAQFLAPLSVRKIPGVGSQMQSSLTKLGVETVADLRKIPLQQLSAKMGKRIGVFLFNSSRGKDSSLVQDKGSPKSISVMDSFKVCKTMQRAAEILRVLAPDLIRRLDEDREETGRRPKTLSLKWRVPGPGYKFQSVSAQMPLDLVVSTRSMEERAFDLVNLALKLLARNVPEPFEILVFSLGATNFVSDSGSSSPGVIDIRSFLQGGGEGGGGQGKSSGKELKVISKRDARANRESFKAMVADQALDSAGKLDRKIGPKRKLQDWDASARVVEEQGDEYHHVASSEEEDIDDLAHQLRLPGYSISEKKGKHVREASEAKEFPSLQEQEKTQAQQQVTPLSRVWASLSGMQSTSDLQSSSWKQKLDIHSQVASGKLQTPIGEEVSLSGAPTEVGRAPSKYTKLEGQNLGNGHPQKEIPCGSSIINRLGIGATEIDCRVDANGTAEQTGGNQSAEDPMGGIAWWTCEKCGMLVEEDESARQEHDDYHFALNLDKLERSDHLLPRPSESANSPATSSSAAVANRRKIVTPSTARLKKPKGRSGTLDGFVFRQA